MRREVNKDQHVALLRLAFEQIAPQPDWKGPVDAVVPWETANVYMQAIELITGSVAKHESVYVPGEGRFAILTAVGYRVAMGG